MASPSRRDNVLLPGAELLPPHLAFPPRFPRPGALRSSPGGRAPQRSGLPPCPPREGSASAHPAARRRPQDDPGNPSARGCSLPARGPRNPSQFPSLPALGGAGRLRSCRLSRSGISRQNRLSLALWQHPQRAQQNCSTAENAELAPAAVSPRAGRGPRGLMSCPLWAVAVAGGQ